MSNFARFMLASSGGSSSSGSSIGTEDTSGLYSNTVFHLKTSSETGDIRGVTDSSSSGHSITTNDYTKITSFNPFRQSKTTTVDAQDSDFVTVASGAFPAMSYLQVPAGTPFAYGTGDFTFETWVMPLQVGTQYIMTQTVSGSNYVLWEYTAAVYGGWMGHPASGYTQTHYNWPEQFVANKWYHLAAVRESGSLKHYINGKYMGSVTNNIDFSNTTYAPTIGTYTHSLGSSPMQSRLYNFRISKGIARYTGTTDFVPPRQKLVSDSYTSLLLASNSTRDEYIDESSHNHTITYSHTSSPRRALIGNWYTAGDANSKNGYDPANDCGSAQFSYITTAKTGQFIKPAHSSDFDFGSNDWCVECWFFYHEIGSGLHTLFNFDDSTSGSYYKMLVAYRPNNDGLIYGLSSTGSGWNIARADTSSDGFGTVGDNRFANRWNHFAFCRNGQNISAFVNGVKDFSLTGVTASLVSNNYSPTIGAFANDTSNFTGAIAQFRVVNGSSVYDPTASTITVPTEKLTAIANTKLLLEFKPKAYDVTGNWGIRSSLESNATTVVQTSSAVTKYADTSLYFDGSSMAVTEKTGQKTSNHTAASSYGTIFDLERDFTIEFWVYFTAHGRVMDFRPGAEGNYITFWMNANVMNIYFNSGNRIAGTTTVSLNTWYHFALCRVGSTWTLYQDGTATGSTYTNTAVAKAPNPGQNGYSGPTIGGDGRYFGQYRMTGYMEDIRITNGNARYTSNFTPPTAALPTYG